MKKSLLIALLLLAVAGYAQTDYVGSGDVMLIRSKLVGRWEFKANESSVNGPVKRFTESELIENSQSSFFSAGQRYELKQVNGEYHISVENNSYYYILVKLTDSEMVLKSALPPNIVWTSERYVRVDSY